MDSTTPFQPWTSKDASKNIVKTEEESVDDAKLHRENVNQPKHTQTATRDKEAVPAPMESPGTSASSDPQPSTAPKEAKMDAEKIASMQQVVENTLSPIERQRVGQLLVAIEGLSGPERLLLYLRLPTGIPPYDPLKQPVNPLGSRAELQQTITWIQTHLEVDPDVSLPKQDVYDEYIAFCMSSDMKPLSTADFGKVMKQVYPTVRPRRLGTRGNSRYCYAGLRKRIKLEVPQLPELGESSKKLQDMDVTSRGTERIICDWAETKLGAKFLSLSDLSRHLQSVDATTAVGPASITPPLPMPHTSSYVPGVPVGLDDPTSTHLMKQLKRKIQTQSQPGRPKKLRPPEEAGPPSPPPAADPFQYGHTYPPHPYVPPDLAPINLSWTRRRPPSPPPRPPVRDPHADYLPKKMRAAESLRPAEAAPPFLEDPKNAASRSTSTAAALVREREAARERLARGGHVLDRERVNSVCGMDKHALDDYLHEGNSQEHEEELLQYFQRDAAAVLPPDVDRLANPGAHADDRPPVDATFLETAPDPRDDRARGKSEKLSQLRELLAKNLKSQSGAGGQHDDPGPPVRPPPTTDDETPAPPVDGATAPFVGTGAAGYPGPYVTNGIPASVPHSPTSRAQQYDFVPISDGCRSPAEYGSKSPAGPAPRRSPRPRGPALLGGSLQTSPAASPFVSPRDTPAPRSRLCSRPIPKPGRRRRTPLSLDGTKRFAMPTDQKYIPNYGCGAGLAYCQPMSAPPSPNILCAQYKPRVPIGVVNGAHHLNLNFSPNMQYDYGATNGDRPHPLSADPLSSEVSQFFRDSVTGYAPDASFRSQSVPPKRAMCVAPPSYNTTPVGSVPPTPVPHEFSDFGSLADTCDISRACLNPESLDKIYDAIDSSDVLAASATLLASGEPLANGHAPCGHVTNGRTEASVELDSLIAADGRLIDTGAQFEENFPSASPAGDNVEELLKRANSIEFDLADLETDRTKYYVSRSVPGTPLPGRRPPASLSLDSRRSREFFAAETYVPFDGISSKSVPSTPLTEDRSVFSYSNRDFLINGNTVEGAAAAAEDALGSPLHDMMLDPLTPAADLLADLDKIDAPYTDI